MAGPTGLGWMAWTWWTGAFWLVIVALILSMSIWEWRRPGGAPRLGVLRIVTTRGDRLFVSLLSAAYIHLTWMAVLNAPLWGATIVAVFFSVFVFRYV